MRVGAVQVEDRLRELLEPLFTWAGEREADAVAPRDIGAEIPADVVEEAPAVRCGGQAAHGDAAVVEAAAGAGREHRLPGAGENFLRVPQVDFDPADARAVALVAAAEIHAEHVAAAMLGDRIGRVGAHPGQIAAGLEDLSELAPPHGRPRACATGGSGSWTARCRVRPLRRRRARPRAP